MLNRPCEMSGRSSVTVLSAPIDVLDLDNASARIQAWARQRESRYVCFVNVHALVAATHQRSFARVLRRADMNMPDGAPVAWMQRRLGYPAQARVSGPDLMWHYCRLAAATGESIFLYGSTSATLESLQAMLGKAFPGLRIAGAISPPFRELTQEEDRDVVNRINTSGAGLVWVGLGCPRQEQWMAAHRGRVHAVMVGVGAAFDFHAGAIKRAPLWWRSHGLEWLYRLWCEPGRLWRRYLVTNTLFVLYAAYQLLFKRGRVRKEQG